MLPPGKRQDQFLIRAFASFCTIRFLEFALTEPVSPYLTTSTMAGMAVGYNPVYSLKLFPIFRLFGFREV
jgi:hypothetical protein